MTLYFFDVMDDGKPARRMESERNSDRNAIPDEAVAFIARDRLPDGAHRSLSVSVRENEGPVIFKATLSLQAGWQ